MSSCPANCSVRPPPWSPDNDINGPGVITNYVASAGFAVLVILLYFFVAFDPTLDPFAKDEKSVDDPPFRPNAIDLLLTRKLRGWFPGCMSRCLNKRWEKSFVKCVIAMGDLQLITGLSILISGAVQLKCGLTIYEWQIMVYLAWFSCLTHLSCLMVLRNHLYVHTFGRTWRLIAMGVLAVLLIIGLLPTANYGEMRYSGPTPSEYAKCYLKLQAPLGIPLCSVILSILTIAIGFISRVIKLHKVLSVRCWGRLRTRASHRSRAILRAIYKRCTTGGPMRGLCFCLVYRPLLAVFLVARFVLDAWVSMFVETLWLLIAFIWGVIRLMSALNDTPYGQDLWTNTAGQNKDNWSFGQVVSLLLLIAPLMSLLEYFDHDPARNSEVSVSREFPGHHEPMGCLSNMGPPPLLGTFSDLQDMDGNWSDYPETVGVVIVYGLIALIAITIQLFLPLLFKPLLRIVFSLEWGIKVILALTGTYGVVLFSLLIQWEVSKESKRARRSLQFLNIAYHVVSFNLGGKDFAGIYSLGKGYLWLNLMQPMALGFYGIVAVVFLWARNNQQITPKG